VYKVYCHIFPNGKVYIGITRNSLEKRWGNGKNYSTCILVNRAIDKYGWGSVTHKLLDDACTKEEAEAKEKYWIDQYNSTDPKHGYNLLPGGDVSNNCATPEMRYKLGNGNRGRKHSESEKKKISEGVKKRFDRPESNGHFGLRHTTDTKNKMSISQRERWDLESRKRASERMKERMSDLSFKDKAMRAINSIPKRKPGEFHQTDDAKNKISKAMKGRWIGENSPCSKPIVQYTKNGEYIKKWANAGEAARAGYGCRRNINKCCNRAPHVHTVAGYVWRFENDSF